MGCEFEDSKKYGPIKFNYNFNEEKEKEKNTKKKKVIYKKPVRYNFSITNHDNTPPFFINLNQSNSNISKMDLFDNNTENNSDEERKTDNIILKNKNPPLMENNYNSNNNVLQNSLNLIFPLENQPQYENNNYYDDQKLVEEIIHNSLNTEIPQYNFEENYFNNNVIDNNPIYTTPNRSIVRKIYPSNESPIEINNNISNTPRYHDLNNFQYNNNFVKNQDYDHLFQSVQNPNFDLINTNPYEEVIKLPLRHSMPLKSYNNNNTSLSQRFNNINHDNNISNIHNNYKIDNYNANNLDFSFGNGNNSNFSFTNNPKKNIKSKKVYLRNPVLAKKYINNNINELDPSQSINNEVVNYCSQLNFKGFEDFSPDLWRKFYPDDEIFFEYNKGDVINSQITSENDLGEKETYNGEVNQNGEKNGFGRLFSNNRNRIGTWRKNKFTGWGREVRGNGDIYEGKFENGELIGKGIFKNNKMFYVGDFYKFIKHGKGDLFTDKYHYRGYFSNDKKNLKGKMEIFDHGIYEGTFIDDEITGKGTFMWKHGAIYEGEIKNGKLYGKGKMKSENGTVYEGNFADFNKGYGIITYPDGSKKKGEFQIVNKIPNINGYI